MNCRYCRLIFITLGILGIIYTNRKMIGRRNEQLNTANKVKDIFDRWLTLKEQGISFERYLQDNDVKKVGIYGLGLMGNHLYEDLIKTSYKDSIIGIDKSEIHDNYKMNIKKPDENLEGVDIIIVTVSSGYNAVENELRKHYSGKIVSLENMLSACENYYTYVL